MAAPPSGQGTKTGVKTASRVAAAVLGAAIMLIQQDSVSRKKGPDATAYSARNNSLQQQFNAAVRDVATVIIDRDRLEENRALTDADLGRPEDRRQLMADFITAQIGAAVLPERLSALSVRDPLEIHASTYAFSYHFMTGRNDQQRRTVCLLFGHDSHIDGDTQLRRFLGLNDALHPNLANRPLTHPLGLALANAYTDYHEFGHCADTHYYQQSLQAGDAQQRLVLRHKAEMYGDVMATLLLARTGVTDAAALRADMRLVGMALNGPVAVNNYDPVKNETVYYSSFIYAIHGGLRTAQNEIDARGAQMAQLTIEDLRDLAFRIVEDNALGWPEAQAIAALQKDVYSLSRLEKNRGRSAAAEHAYQFAASLRAAINDALPRVIDVTHFDAKRDILAQVRFDLRVGATAHTVTGAEKRVRDEIIRQAGGKNADAESLLRAYRAYKDERRAVLLSPQTKERARAMEDLSMAGAAIKNAIKKAKPSPRAP